MATLERTELIMDELSYKQIYFVLKVNFEYLFNYR